MVTLLGFFFILLNVICLVIFMPDLVGPVRFSPMEEDVSSNADALFLPGTVVVILQLCVWFVDVFDNGQCGWEAGATNRHIKWSWRAV